MNAILNTDPQTSGFTFDHFYSTVNAYYRTAAVKAAIELGLFEIVGERGMTVAGIAQACAASERGIRILCHYLVSIGFLKNRDGMFFMTVDMAMFLDPKSPGYLGDSIQFLLSPYIMGAFSDLTSVIRGGQISLSADGVVAPDHPQWVTFARAMQNMMSLPSMLLAKVVEPRPAGPIRVLDVAAGHGRFGIATALRNPQAHVTFLDWDNVLDVARDNVRQAGIGARCEFRPGNAFEIELGQDYDVILLTNFLHHFDRADCERFLRKVHAALKPQGRVLTFEIIADEDRVSPPMAAIFSMMMLGTTPAGEVYAFSDLRDMFAASGYSKVELQAIPPARERVVVSYR